MDFQKIATRGEGSNNTYDKVLYLYVIRPWVEVHNAPR